MGRKRKVAIKNIPEASQQRMEMVYLVCTGQMTARAAARRLGVSPKTYYAWERRVLAASAQAVTKRPAGRPAITPDPEKELMRTELAELHRRLAERDAELKAGALFSEFSNTLREAGVISSPDKKKGR